MCKYFHEILMTVFLFISNQLCTTTEKANFVVLPKGSMQKKKTKQGFRKLDLSVLTLADKKA